MKPSDMKSLDQLIQDQRRDPEFREEWDKTAFARQVAIQVTEYRTQCGKTQKAFAATVGFTQSVIARLESGEHTPSLTTLARLSARTGLVFHLDVRGGAVELVDAAA